MGVWGVEGEGLRKIKWEIMGRGEGKIEGGRGGIHRMLCRETGSGVGGGLGGYGRTIQLIFIVLFWSYPARKLKLGSYCLIVFHHGSVIGLIFNKNISDLFPCSFDLSSKGGN